MILKSEESVHVSLPALVLSADHVLLSSTVTIPEESVYLTALNSSLSEYSVSSARTVAEHMHFFLIFGCPVLQFLFHFTCFCYCFSFSSSVLCFPEYLLSSDGQISIFTCQTVQKDFTGCSSSLAHFLSLPT